MSETPRPSNFIRNHIDADLAAGKNDGKVVTRFPPEPNGYLHIGHAKSICLNFGLALDYDGRCHLRFDDTNPTKEDVEYIDSIIEDVRWLGFDWGEHQYHAADYFGQLYEWAEALVKAGKAYVDDLNAEEIRAHRGTLTEAGTESPHRNRSPEENLELFRQMRDGAFPDGSKVLRAKIDMASPNMNLRDPVMYRILRAPHHRTGDDWLIYPMYDWAHGQSDAIEGITHSICTLEFEAHRPLYDWFLDQLVELGLPARPRQIEFARLNLTFTVMSKRKLMLLVSEGLVDGWDDPRMPTIAGLRRRGYTPASIREFCDRIGVAKADSLVDVGMLESAIRDDLNPSVPRTPCVHEPLEVEIDNFGDDEVVEIEVPNFPDEPEKMGHRTIRFTKHLYIEREDFMEDAPRKFFRLAPGREVRLRQAYVAKCVDVVKNEAGEVVKLHCTVDRETLGGPPADGRKVKGTIHWVSAENSAPVEVRLYDRLFNTPNPSGGGEDFHDHINPDSLRVLKDARVEKALLDVEPGSRLQFERKGYYYVDTKDSKSGAPVFHRIVPLRDSWAKIMKAHAAQQK